MRATGSRSKFLWPVVVAFASSLTFLGFEYFSFLLPLSIVAGAYGLYLGSDMIVDQSSLISARIGLSRKKEGFLLLSIAAIADEIFLTIIAASLGFGDISFGAVQGSNDFTLASVIVMIPLFGMTVKIRHFGKDIAFLLGSAIVVILLSYAFSVIPVYIAPLFFAIFIAYIMILASSKQEDPVEPTHEERFSIPALAISAVLLFVSSFALVIYADFVSTFFHITGFLGGFLLTGLTGSIPEIFIIFITARKAKVVQSLSVLIGSTVYKLTLVLGVVSLFGNLTFEFSKWSSYLLILMILLLVAVTLIAVKKYYAPLLAAIIVAASALLYVFA